MYSKFKNFFKQNLLTILTIVGVVLGVVVGLIVRATVNAPLTNREIMYINFIGDLFLRMLKALIIPLIVSSLVAAISSLDLTLSKKIGGYAIGYYLITTVLAVILGIILVTTVRPGVRSDAVTTYTFNNHRNITTTDTLLDLVRNMFPPNVIQACLQQYQTVLKQGNSQLNDIEKWKVSGEFYDGTNILGLVVVSVVIGITMSSLKDETVTLAKLFKETSGIMMKITSCVIWISPIGVFFLICSKILEIEDLQELSGKLGLYFVTVAGGILFHGFIILPIIYFFFTKNNPYKFITKMSQAMATAFGTASSSATLPVTITCLETKNGIDSRVSRFVLPIGATINMDGTALYEAVAAIFIAQLKEVPLSFGSIIAICITATAASIGAAGIPHAGLVTLVMVLDTVGLPAEDVSIIIAVDWLIDRIRTLVNVLGDSFGAGIVFHLNRNELDKIQPNTGPTHTSSLNLVLTPNNTIISSEML